MTGAETEATRAARRVVVFAFDIAEASQIRTIRAIRACDACVSSFSFRRGNMNAGFHPDWQDTPLGHAPNGVGPGRLAALVRGAIRVLWHRRRLRQADVLLARNLDMALLALLGRWASGSRTPLVYQCLDIHGLFARRGPLAALARRAERFVLDRTHRLVVSSPRYLGAHFGPVHGWKGPSQVVENGIWWPDGPPSRPAAGPRPEGPLRLGWVGTLRCPLTLALLVDTADRMGPRVQIVLRGVVHRHQLPEFDRVLSVRPNMRYEGPYTYPQGLEQAYRGLDCVWAQDLWQAGANSDWLLPNRLYEAGFFGCPVIAVGGTETASAVRRRALGLTIPEARAETLVPVLDAGRTALSRLRRGLLARPAAEFCLSRDDVGRMLDLDVPGSVAIDAGPERDLSRAA